MPFPASTVEGPGNQSNWDFLSDYFIVGKGNPAGEVKARIGALFLREDGEPKNTLYFKGSGEGTSEGWVVVVSESGEGGGYATVEELVEEAEARAAADKAEKEAREAADTTIKGEVASEKSAREAADTGIKGEVAAEKAARETADNERVKGPGSATNLDIAVFDGTTGKLIKDGGMTIAQVLDRANHTGTQLASTISNFNEAVRTNRLDQMATPTANVSFGEKKITKLADPTEALDGANKEYVDAAAAAAAAGLSYKQPVAYASTAALTVTEETALTLKGTGTLTFDSKSGFATGTRVLPKNQVAEKQNGIYTVTKYESFGGGGKFGGEGKFGEGGGWTLTRASDADTTEEVKQGMTVPVTSGPVNGSTEWILQTENPIVIGTTAQTFNKRTTTPSGPAGGVLTGTYPNPESKYLMGVELCGATGENPRPPGVPYNFWIGTVEPKNAAANDPWFNPEDTAFSYRDYGLVSALPTSPTPSAGDKCTFKTGTAGILWELVYDGEGEYPWKVIGGPPLRIKAAQEKATTSTTFVSFTTAITLTTPLKGDYDIDWGAQALFNTTTQNTILGVSVDGSTPGYPIAVDSVWGGGDVASSTGGPGPAGFFSSAGVGASKTIEVKVRVSGASTGTAWSPWLKIRPTRVG